MESLPPDGASPRVLLVEDDAPDRRRVRRLVAGIGAFALESESTLQAGLDRLAKGDVDVLLLDLHLPGSEGIGALEQVVDQGTQVPVVVFARAGDDATALAALRAGATEYLMEEEITGASLQRAIHCAIERGRIACEDALARRREDEAEKQRGLTALALGTAFAFNTHLGSILDCADRGLVDLAARRPDQARRLLTEIREAALAAARLTEEMRTFAGATTGDLRRVDLSSLAVEASEAFEGAVPSQIDVQYDLAGGLPQPAVDSAQLRQLLASLVANAREAIGRRAGTITIETGSAQLSERTLGELVADRELAPGEYVFLRVRDTGDAIDPRVRGRIFDPFFTTKFQGRGLGLAAVRGIVRRHDGGIAVESTPGRGTAITIFLPAA